MPNNDFDVFISYSSKDQKIADGLVAYLEQQGIRCWMAPRNIQAGQTYPMVIPAAISHSSVFVLIFSAKSSVSSWVCKEATKAVDAQKIIIPFKIDDTLLAGNLLELLLIDSQWIDATPNPETHFPEVAEAIRRHLGRPAPKPDGDASSSPDEPSVWDGIKNWVTNAGSAVADNLADAAKLPQKLTEQGVAAAQCKLGELYAEGGWGVKQDPKEAVKWFRKAAKQNNPDAQYKLGECYFDGFGVTPKKAEAVKWFRKAAKQGSRKAQTKLGECYEHGWGVRRNLTAAQSWFKKAAEQGFEEAQAKLRELGQ